MVIQKVNYSYVIRTETITIFSNNDKLNQSIAFNRYSVKEYSDFNRFRKTIEKSRPEQYDDINEIYGLARHFNLTAARGHKPTFVDGKIAF